MKAAPNCPPALHDLNTSAATTSIRAAPLSRHSALSVGSTRTR
jgi:hypothetical protein